MSPNNLAEGVGGKERVIGGPFGSKLTQKDYTASGIPVIRGSNMPSHGRKVSGDFAYVSPDKFERDLRSNAAMPGDIIVTQRGTLGQVAILPDDAEHERYVVSQSQMAIRVDPQRADRDFVFYYLTSPAFNAYVETTTIQTGVPHINLGILRDAPIRWPLLKEQTAIATALRVLDDKIELNRRMNETLEAMARAIFRDWFIDFGPTRAKMEGRAPYLTPDVWSLFPDAIGEATGLPEGWRAGTVADLIEFNPTETLRREARAPYLDMASLPTSGAVAEPPIAREFGSGMKFRDGDALLARITPCLENGKAAYIQGLGDGVVAWGSTEFIVMRSKPPVPSPVSYLFARDSEFKAHAVRSMTGTSGRQRAQADMIAAFAIAIPDSPDLWQHLGNLLQPMFERIGSNAAENTALAAMRDYLLPKLMSGEIEVREMA